jgi:ubiquinone/menaquinone biosynthesis C-methylase UbiE
MNAIACDREFNGTRGSVRAKYDGYARWYDLDPEPLVFEFLLLHSLRRRLYRQARGRVLDVAAGTGRNLRHFPPPCRVVAVDLSRAMLDIARRRRRCLAMTVMDSESLAFADGSFDTVACSLATCTFPDPVAALREMRRVCRPDGRVLLLEHGRSAVDAIARFQDATAEWHAARLECRWNRDPLDFVRRAGLTVIRSRRVFLGVFHAIEAAPTA